MHQMVLKTQNTEIKSGRMCVCVLGQVFEESGKMFLVNWHRRSLTYKLPTNLFNQTPLHYGHSPVFLRETEFI